MNIEFRTRAVPALRGTDLMREEIHREWAHAVCFSEAYLHKSELSKWWLNLGVPSIGEMFSYCNVTTQHFPVRQR